MTSLTLAIIVIAVLFAASLAVERAFGRSRKIMIKPGWYYVFFAAFTPLLLLVFNFVPIGSDFLYAAYALSGGVAALAAQCFYGAKIL